MAEISSPGRRIRVVSIAHSGVLRDMGRLRYQPLADRHDLDIHLVVPERWYQFGRWYEADPPCTPGITTHVLPIRLPKGGPASWYLHFYPSLRRLMRQVSPDVVHLWEEPWSIVALQALLLRRKAGYVLEVDQNIIKRLPLPFEKLRRFILARTDVILARSNHAEEVVRACGYAGPALPIGYGVDEETFRLPEIRRLRPDSGLRLGYCGRLVVEKGLDDALDALAALPDSVTLALMGEGDHDAALRARIARLGLQNRVSFAGWGSPRDVAAFYHGIDVSILLTRTTDQVREQFGRAIIESQGCGVPVIGSTCGAIPEVIGQGGWVVPEQDPAEIAGCVRQILAVPALLDEKSRLGQQNIRDRFSYRAVAGDLAAGWLEAYRRRMAGSAAA